MSADWPIRPAAVALGLIDADDALAADTLMREDPAFRREVEALRRAGDVLASTRPEDWERAAPPPLDLELALDARPAAPRRAPRGRRRRRRRVGLVAAAAVVVLALGIVIGRQTGGGPGDDGRAIALDPLPGGGDRTARAVLTMSTGKGDLMATGLPASRPGEFYEVWLLGADGHAASVVTFRVGADGRADVRFAMGADPSLYRVLDISRERDDGDPAHSGDSVLRSRALS